MRGGIFAADVAEAEAHDRVLAEPSMTGADFAREVSPREPVILEGDGPRVIAIDTGIKDSIVRNLRDRGVHLELHPCDISAEALLERRPDAVFLANGPGDPAALDYVVETVRGVVGKVPVWGICLGHQLLCRAVGLETYKLPFGHRGANHPVKDLETGKIEITSQNHGFAVLGPGGRDDDRHRRAGALGDGLRRRRAPAAEPLRPDGGGAGAARRARRRRSSTTRRPGPARTTRSTCSTASWSGCRLCRVETTSTSILVLGSGPIVIGQAAEFDYSGAQACKVLLEEGYEVILVNSNPATIMTDPEFATAHLHRAAAARVGRQGDRARAAGRAAAHARRRHGAEPRARS